MPNIDQDLARIMEARYGKDVRQSIHDAIKDINDVADSQVSTIEGYLNQAYEKADEASRYANDAYGYATYANSSADTASDKASEANEYATSASNSATTAGTKATEAAQSEAKAKEYCDKSKIIADTLETGIRPLGTITFDQLPSVNDQNTKVGDTYNISEDFVSTSDFMDGGGKTYPASSDVYLTVDRKWDVKAYALLTDELERKVDAVIGMYVQDRTLYLPNTAASVEDDTVILGLPT